MKNLKIMKIKTLKNRTYIFFDNKRKMIPAKYKKVCLQLKNEGFDFEKKRLTIKERFLLELELFKMNLKEENFAIFNLIKNEMFYKCYKVSCKFSVPRFEVRFGNFSVICSKILYDLCDKENKEDKHVYY